MPTRMNHQRFARASCVVAAVAFVSAGCAGAGGNEGTTDRSSYPAGPYGTAQGDVIESLSFQTSAGEPFGLGDVFADTDTKLLLLSTAAGWCTACIEEQGALEELAQTHGEDGLEVMVALFEDRDYQPATPALAEQWTQEHSLTFPVVIDPDFVLAEYYDEALTPMNMIVDVNTMTMLRISTGWDPSAITAIIEARL
jgi:thiol-disulfide isomerase/thioredoxin